ncbi:hypothetical protein P3T23_001046 [Paraburkholderia sp. GAS448]|uniref:GIY-YIG nuclease family protein n=1 Tax=Paraburkholderia sp. GAS448 TaxID=3035136 RepID=UPI003D1C531C
MNGLVCVFSNKALPGLSKLGHTFESAEARAHKLSTAGIPHSYNVAFSIHVEDALLVKSRVKRALHKFRAEKEFFCCSPLIAATALREAVAALEDNARASEPSKCVQEAQLSQGIRTDRARGPWPPKDSCTVASPTLDEPLSLEAADDEPVQRRGVIAWHLTDHSTEI